MNKLGFIKSPQKLSNILTILFIVVVSFLFIATEIFRARPIIQISGDSFSDSIGAQFLSRVKKIQITNRLGTFELYKVTRDSWSIMEPRTIPSDRAVVLNLLKSIGNLKIISTLKNDQLNRSNFSLDDPLSTIQLKTDLDEETSLTLGMINPIDNTAYIQISKNNLIYQVEAPELRFEGLEFSQFIDSKIFQESLESILSFEIYRGQSSLYERLTLNQGVWTSLKSKNISAIKVENFLEKILKIQAYMIIDKKSESLSQIIENYLKNPSYTIKVKTEEREIIYRVSGLVSTLPDLKIEKKNYFLMDSNERDFPYLIHKDNLDLFSF